MEDNDVVLKSFFEKLVDEHHKNDFNIGTCLSFLSYIFKLNIGNDNLVQNFEVHFCRKNFYKLNSLADIVDVVDADCNEKEKVNFDVFKQISLFLLSVIEKENEENNNGELSNFDEIIGEIRCIIQKSSEKQANDDKKLQTNFDDTAKERYFELSPTGGIAKLNNNPYSFFLDKVLGISDIEEWNEYFDAKTYGNLVHKIMQNFAYACIKKTSAEEINNELFFEVCKKSFADFRFDEDAFISSKLKVIAETAVELEKEAKENNVYVFVEKDFTTKIKDITIKARADRVEIDKARKTINIYDFKTGQLPNDTKEKNGEKTQLSILAFIILQQPEYAGFSIKKMKYIDVSGMKKKKEEIISNDLIEITEKNLYSLVKHYFNSDKNENIFNIDEMFFVPPSGKVYDNDISLKHFARCEFL